MDEIITRYGDVGTPERHKKFNGVRLSLMDNGQPQAVCAVSSYIDYFQSKGVWDSEQAQNAKRLCFDYEVGCLSTHSHPIQNYHRNGGAREEFNERQEEARKRHNAAIQYYGEFIKISNLCHLLLEHEGVYIPAPWKLQKLCDRLIRYYLLFDKGLL